MKRFIPITVALALVGAGCTVSKESTDTAAAVDTSAAMAPAAPAPAAAVTPAPATATPPAAPAASPPAAPTATPPAAPGAIKKIDLNTATDAEILAIPGMGPRMLREFKEYRPYTSMEQFRREIGKYVSKDEVARLEQYVYIK
jgi:DNA uptake protein ComE-like DNA-binding protein